MRRRQILLLFGMLVGFALATKEITRPGANTLPDEAAAKVGSILIPNEEYQQLLSLLQQGKRSVLSAEEKLNILERMIDERLLISQGLKIGLVERDPAVRKSIVNAMIQAAISSGQSDELSEKQLLGFYRAEKNYFSRGARLHIRLMRFSSTPQASNQASTAYAELKKGRSFDEVRTELASRTTLRVPDTLLPANKLRDYIGPSLLLEAKKLSPGEFSEPLVAQNGYAIVQLVNKQLNAPPPFAQIREQVKLEYKRRQDEQTLRDYLDRLRAREQVLIDERLRPTE